MKKIAVLTTHRANNYGAALQSYALTYFINKIFRQRNDASYAEILDYRCPCFEHLYHRKPSLRERMKKTHFALTKKRDKATEKAFEKFRNSHMRISSRAYVTPEELHHAAETYDTFIAGSDQIWNPANTTGDVKTFDQTYLLDFVDKKKKKHSYAASIGLTCLSEELENVYIKQLSSFTTLSLREHTGANLIEKLLNRNASAVVDPVLLLTEKEWEDIEKQVQSIQANKYLLVYNVLGGTLLQQYAEKVAAELGLPLFFIQPPVTGEVASGTTGTLLHGVGPQEFVWLLRNAAQVITTSFHGSAFSLLFGKKIHIFLDDPQSKQQRNSRIESLLKYFGIDDDYIEYQPRSIILSPNQTHKQNLDLSRQQSLEVLNSIIG